MGYNDRELSIRMPPEVLDRISALHEKLKQETPLVRITRSDVIRMCLDEGLRVYRDR